jgi:hypothetical protein
MIASLIAALLIAALSSLGTAVAAPITVNVCSAEASSSPAAGSHVSARAGSSTSSSSSSGAGSSSTSVSSKRTTTSGGITTTTSCQASARVVVQANGQRYSEAKAVHDGVTVEQRDPTAGTAASCHASASA